MSEVLHDELALLLAGARRTPRDRARLFLTGPAQ